MDVEQIFLRAQEIHDPPARAAYIEGACQDKKEKQAEVETLIQARQAGIKKEDPAGPAPDLDETADILTLPEVPGTVIGRYKLLEQIGEGGNGIVWAAEQRQPVKRRVAFKILKPGMDTKQVIARFEAERQALALMDHANIAKVLDAGATETGRPYFVMELVRGMPITHYCDQGKLSTQDRLELFIKICHAIQHAHQKGIIHRDIKPANIMVSLHDGIPVPKVIDFGIAKATQQKLTENTVFTQFQQLIGTPAYMSPEQAEMSGLDVDTRTDIYSLGVLLYELLTGSTPLDTRELMQSGLDQMRRIIREREPYRPSNRVGTLSEEDRTTTAHRQSTESPKLISSLRGDLDWIVMKCLEKDRTRRYETANALATDIKRHLEHQPVVARPPNTMYRLQKAWHRNKTAYCAGAAVFVALIVSLSLAASGWRQARRQHEEALQARANEETQRIQAEQSGQKAIAAQLVARQRAYSSDMNLAMQALRENNLGRAQDRLDRQRPQYGESDLRGWEWRYLWQQTRSDALATLCQKSEIESLTMSSDGRWLAIGVVHNDGIFVWDMHARQEVAHLAQGQHEVRAAFSPTEPLLAFASKLEEQSGESSNLNLWNAGTGQIVAKYPLSSTCVGLAFSADGQRLVTSTESNTGSTGQITIWKVSDGSKLASYASEQYNLKPGTAFTATSDLSRAAYGLQRERFCVKDLRSGKELWTAVASQNLITALAFSPDGKTLASAAGFGETDIRLWDVATGQEIGRLEGHDAWVGSLVFWPDGSKLASGAADQTIRTWDLASRTCTDVLRGHRNEVWRLALLPDKQTLISGAKDGVACLWDVSIAHPRQEHITWTDKVLAWCFTSDSGSVLTLNEQGQVTRWTGSEFQEAEPLLDIGVAPAQGGYLCYRFSPDGRVLVGGSPDGSVSVWDISQRRLLREFRPVTEHVYPLHFLAQGTHLVGWSEATNHLYEWDLATGREIQSWPAPTAFHPLFNATGHSPDELQFAVAGFRGDAVARNLRTHSSTKLHLDIVEPAGLTFDGSGRFVAIASLLGYVRVWDTRTWDEVATLPGFLNAATSVTFSPDGSRLATSAAAESEALKLWAVDNWQEVLTLHGEGHLFDRAAFSPDGHALGVVTQLGRLFVWQAPSWEEIAAAEKRQHNDRTNLHKPVH